MQFPNWPRHALDRPRGTQSLGVFSDNEHQMTKHGFTIRAIKEWRETEHKAGRPSGLDDFYRAHEIDICVECHGQGTRVVGTRWRDKDGVERAEEGPVAFLVQYHGLDAPTCWLTDALKWDYLYAPCLACDGSGKLQPPLETE